jgi:hypothetical protein
MRVLTDQICKQEGTALYQASKDISVTLKTIKTLQLLHCPEMFTLCSDWSKIIVVT